ncbi:hypothetical protein ACJRO7_020580 [Eucalyptus globulus]|uniref:Transport inhibitor response 1 domain-containing protein n=1 Tax=Eucalyptus globulus TaxID=34317 RepID=A0ABD3KLJ6_EUCGL
MPYIHVALDGYTMHSMLSACAGAIHWGWLSKFFQRINHLSSSCPTLMMSRMIHEIKHKVKMVVRQSKGKPRLAMFNLIIKNGLGYVTPWVTKIVRSLNCLK